MSNVLIRQEENCLRPILYAWLPMLMILSVIGIASVYILSRMCQLDAISGDKKRKGDHIMLSVSQNPSEKELFGDTQFEEEEVN